MSRTLLEILAALFNHNDKEKIAHFSIIFSTSLREVKIAKKWNKLAERFEYVIQDHYTYAYSEAQFVSALANVNGLRILQHGSVPYDVTELHLKDI